MMASGMQNGLGLEGLSLSDKLPCSEVARKLPGDAYDQMMIIEVGDGDSMKQFQVHRALLCHFSELFRRLMNGRFKDSNSHKLPNEKVETFQMFRNWLYTGDLASSDNDELQDIEIVNIYIFADFYMVPQLRDRALDLYLLQYAKSWVLPQDCTKKIYENTSEKSALRKLHVDMMVETFGFGNLREWLEEDPKEYLADVMEVCRDKKVVLGSGPGLQSGGRTAWVDDKKKHFCMKYHEHPKPEPPPTVEPADEVTEEHYEMPERPCYSCGQAGHIQHACLNRKGRRPITCWNCEQKGHSFYKCPLPKDWSKVVCKNCGEKGHTQTRCTFMNPDALYAHGF